MEHDPWQDYRAWQRFLQDIEANLWTMEETLDETDTELLELTDELDDLEIP